MKQTMKKAMSWLLALAMAMSFVPAVASPASAAPAGGSITEWEANALLAGAGTSVVEVALENHYDDPNTDPYGMCGGNSHLQGIAVDDELKYMFFSYTSALAIIEIATGELVASCGGFGQGSFGTPGGSHLGCIDYYDGYIYGSLEYKEPGKKFFLAIFDVERMLDAGIDVSVSEQDMEEPICTAVLLEEPTRDFRAPIDTTLFSGQDEFGHATNEGNNGHYFACSGIDGVSMGKWPGGTDDEIYMIVAYGVYQFSSSARNDNTYNVLEYYKLSDIWNEDGSQTQWNKSYTYTDGIHQNWAQDEAAWLSAAKTLYVYTGNTSYGSQNIEYEWDTGDVVLYTYGNTDGMGGTYYEVDGSVEPELKTLNLGQHSSDEWARNVAKAYKNYPDAVDVDEDGYMMGYVGTLKCVCGQPGNHTTEGNWPTGAPRAENFICSAGAPASATTGIAWIGPDPDDANADWFYVADAALSTGLFKRTYDANGGVAFGKKTWLPEEPLDAEPVMHWTMDAVDMDFENGTVVNAIDENTYGGYFSNVQVADGMDGKPGGSIYFDGDADVLDYSRVWMDEDGIDTLQTLMDGGQITVSYWYKPEFTGDANFTSNWSPILGIYSDARTVQPGQFVLVTEDRSGNLNMCMNNYPTKSNDKRSKGTSVHKNAGWHHIVMTVDLRESMDVTISGSKSLYREFYVDGVAVGNDRALLTADRNTVFDLITDFEIGGAPYKCWSDSNVRGRFSGWIDDVKIYNVSVTSKQAAWLLQHEAKTAAGEFEVPEAEVVETAITNTFSKVAPADVVIELDEAVTSVSGDYLADADYVIDGNTVTISADYLMNRQPGVATVKVNGKDVAINILVGYNPIVWYKTDATDASGYGMNGTLYNGVKITADGMEFRGYDETLVNRIQVANTDYIDKAIDDEATIVFEFKSPRLVGNITNILGLYDDARPGLAAQLRAVDASAQKNSTLGERPGDGNGVRVSAQVFTETSKTWNGNLAMNSANITLNSSAGWHTAAIVYDGSVSYVYVDGVKVGEANVADNALDGVSALVLGGPVNRNYATGISNKSQQIMTNFYGTLKNVAVYNSALSAEQIAAGISVDTSVDTTGLEALIEKVEAMVSSDYSADSYAALAAPLAAAEALLASGSVAVADLDEIAADLLASVNALVDLSALQATVEQAEDINDELYTPSSWAGVVAAIEAAEVVLADADATQGEVDAAIAAINAAVEELIERADKTELQAAIDSTADLRKSMYSLKTWKVLEAALENAEAIMADLDVLQPDVNAAVIDIEAAIEGLRKATASEPIVTGPISGPLVDEEPEVPADPEDKDFEDVADSDWFNKAVDYVVDKGLFSGISDTKFAPGQSMSRAMLAVVLHSKEGKPAAEFDGSFTDVKAGDWYAEAVLWAAGEGIVSGYDNGAYGANDALTREQLAMMLWRYAGSPEAEGELDFDDADKVSAYAVDALVWCVENGIISGKGDGILDSAGKATRAEVAQMMMNFCEL